MTVELDILALNPIHYLPFNNNDTDLGSGTLQDVNGLTDGAVYEALPIVKGRSHSLKANAGFYDAGDSPTVNLDGTYDSITYLAFAKVSSIDTPTVLWKIGGTSRNHAVTMGFGAGHQAMSNTASEGTTIFSLNAFSTRALEPGRIYLFVLTWERGTITGGAGARCRYYVNGVLEGEDTFAGNNQIDAHTGNLTIGNGLGNLLFYGGALPSDGVNRIDKNVGEFACFLNSLITPAEQFSLFGKWSLAAHTVTNQAEVDAIVTTILENQNIALEVDVSGSITLDISRLTLQNNDIDVRYTGTGTLTLLTNHSTLETFNTELGGNIVLDNPAISFTASNITSATFNNVRCRLSLVPNSPIQVNDDGTVSSGGFNFATTDVDTVNNTISLPGIAGKLSSNSVIRFYGSDLPSPLDTRAVYYPSIDYTGNDSLLVSATIGGTSIDLTDVGSGSDMYFSAWTELDIDLITAGDYIVDLSLAASTAGVTLENGDVLTFQAIHHDTPGSGASTDFSNYLEESFQYNSQDIISLSSLSLAANPLALLAEIGLDGSQVTGYSFDDSAPAKVQIDATKPEIDTRELVVFYYYVQWLEAGLRLVRGNIDVQNLNSIAILGELTFDAQTRSVMSGPYTYRLDGKNIVAPESEQISFNWQDTRAAIVETEVAINLPVEVLQTIQSILYLSSQIPNIALSSGGLTPTQATQLSNVDTKTTRFDSLIEDDNGDQFTAKVLSQAPSGGSGSAPTVEEIYTYISDASRVNVFKADVSGLSTFNPVVDTVIVSDKTGFSLTSAAYDSIALAVWSATTRALTDKANFALDTATINSIATTTEAALINEGDGQQLIDAIVQVINSNLDIPAVELQLIAQQVRTELSVELSRLDTEISTRLASNDVRLDFVDAPISAIPTVMRGTDNALTSFAALPNVTIGSYATGLSPAEQIDLTTIETDLGLVLLASESNAKGRSVLDLTNSLYTVYDKTNSIYQAFRLYQEDGVTLATTLEQIAERRPI